MKGFLDAMGFELNRSKTKVLTRHTRQTVTGIVVNDRVSVPAAYRRELRQDIYYCRKFGVREHIRSRSEKKYLDLGEAGEVKYLMSLLGNRICPVRNTRRRLVYGGGRGGETLLKEYQGQAS